MDIILLIVLCMIFVLTTSFLIGWLIIYPIYRKCINKPVFMGSNYAFGLCITSAVLNICCVLITIITRW